MMSKKRLWLVFFLGACTFIVENIVDYRQTIPSCCDRTAFFGVPIPLGYTGGFVGGTVIYWPIVVLGTLLAGGFAVLLALIVTEAIRYFDHQPLGPDRTQ